jgi:hypothetical protein
LLIKKLGQQQARRQQTGPGTDVLEKEEDGHTVTLGVISLVPQITIKGTPRVVFA